MDPAVALDSTPPDSPPPAARGQRWRVWAAMLILVTAGLAAFHNCFDGVMVFDDRPTIIRNPTIRDAGNLLQALHPPLDTTVSGRPLANLSFALNHAIGGLEVGSYHWGNLLVHLAAGLTLFGVIRRTLALRGTTDDTTATGAALAVAMLWLVHPLQTESVTYLVQRVEALAGLFYLLTVYCFLRSVEHAWETKPARPLVWQAACVAACLLGVASKEVVVSAPLLVLLYDRTLVTGSFAGAWRQRRGLYLGLAASWGLLAALIGVAANRAGTAGFGTASSWHYLLTQAGALMHYLRLVFWPEGLVFDYGKGLVTDFRAALLPGLGVLVLLAGTAWACWRRSAWGLLGFVFFAVLAPSSSFVPVATQTMAEHRMYLPLAAVIATVVLGALQVLGRRSLLLWPVLALAAGLATVARNRDYHSELALWTSSVEAWPQNPRAACNLGQTLFELGRKEEAMSWYREALRLQPDYFEAHNNLGVALLGEGDLAGAQAHFEAAVRAKPEDVPARGNLGMIYHARGRDEDALRECREAVRLAADYAEGHSNLGVVLHARGDYAEALKHCREAVRLKPDYAEAHNNLGLVLHAQGEPAGAVTSYERAVALKPDFPEAWMNLAISLHASGRTAEAEARYAEALRQRPDYTEAHYNFANLLSGEGRPEEALSHFREAARLAPESAGNHFALGNALLKAGRHAEALPACEAAVSLDPELAEARSNLGTALFFTGRADAAAEQFEAAIRLRPDYVKAHYFLGNVFASQRRVPEARRCYLRALELDPDYRPAKQNLARLPAVSG